MSTNDNVFGDIVYVRTYARWVESDQRREVWSETCERYRNYFLERFDLPEPLKNKFDTACDMILRKEVMPSMRALWAAGDALDVDNIVSYNCTFALVDTIKSWADMMYLLMSSCGVGYDVERQVITDLPEVPKELIDSDDVIVFGDSRIEWAEGLLEYLTRIYNGSIPKYDLSLIRPRGTRLKTFGGKAGGSDDLKLLLEYIRMSALNSCGRRMTSLEIHDICCWVANVVVAAGIRRSACISLSNLSDQRMRNCKVGEFWKTHPQRSICNNSVAYTEKPDMHIFMQEWMALMESGSGERGIFNREASLKQFEKLGRKTRDSDGNEYVIGMNPCGEVLLRPNQACNLSEVIVRSGDSLKTLLNKIESATVLGCMQACLTDFHFIDPIWKENMEEERLLGVSLTGTRDHEVLGKVSQLAEQWLHVLHDHARSVANECAIQLHINRPMAISCNKPSGTVSSLVNSSSGIHTRFAPYYIRRIRVSTTDVLYTFLKSIGAPNHPEVGQDEMTANTFVFEFPVKSPDGAVFDTPALEQLEYWKMFKIAYTDHNPSVTITVEDDEWLEVGAWVYKNWDIIGGLSFLPKSDTVYQLMPFEAITKEEYEQRVADMPDINFDDLRAFEREDETTGAKTLACTGGNCEVY